MIPLKSNLKFNKSYDLIIVTEPTGKREGGWILVMDKQKGKKNRREGGWRREREMLRFGWMRGGKDLGVGNETIFSPSDGRKKPVAGFQRGSRVRSE